MFEGELQDKLFVTLQHQVQASLMQWFDGIKLIEQYAWKMLFQKADVYLFSFSASWSFGGIVADETGDDLDTFMREESITCQGT